MSLSLYREEVGAILSVGWDIGGTMSAVVKVMVLRGD